MRKVIFSLIALSFLAVSSAQIAGLTCTEANSGRHYQSGFDCSSYYTCFQLEFHLQVCPFPFWFNVHRQNCDLPENISCTLEPLPSTITITTQTPAPTTTTQAPTTVQVPVTSEVPLVTEESTEISDQSTTVTQIPNITCPPRGVSQIRNPFSCTRFFLCFDGVLLDKTCSPGLYFSRAQSRCVRREDSDCLLGDGTCPAENDPDNVIFLPDQEDCQRYFVCHDGAPVEFNCGDSLHWEPNYNWCIKEEDSECTPSYPLPEIREIPCPEDTEDDIVLLPHPEDCQYYFICLNGVSSLQRCSRRLLFDYIRGQCYFPESAVCFDRIVNPSNKSGSSEEHHH